MNNNKLNIDNYTRKLVTKTEVEQPSANFSENVMSKIRKSPSYNHNLITKDDKRNNILLSISLIVMILGYFSFAFINTGFGLFQSLSFEQYRDSLQKFTKIFISLNISPYILLSLIGVLFMAIIDKLIGRKLFSV